MEIEMKISEVLSTGVNSKGDSVVRIMLPSRQIIEVSTNVVGLAKLAAAGVRVQNDNLIRR